MIACICDISSISFLEMSRCGPKYIHKELCGYFLGRLDPSTDRKSTIERKKPDGVFPNVVPVEEDRHEGCASATLSVSSYTRVYTHACVRPAFEVTSSRDRPQTDYPEPFLALDSWMLANTYSGSPRRRRSAPVEMSSGYVN